MQWILTSRPYDIHNWCERWWYVFVFTVYILCVNNALTWQCNIKLYLSNCRQVLIRTNDTKWQTSIEQFTTYSLSVRLWDDNIISGVDIQQYTYIGADIYQYLHCCYRLDDLSLNSKPLPEFVAKNAIEWIRYRRLSCTSTQNTYWEGIQ